MILDPPITSDNIQAIFDAYPDNIQTKLLSLRTLIFEVASDNLEIGQLVETLKWGQVSYLPKKAKIGTTVRLDQVKNTSQYALYVPCSTTLINSYRQIFGDLFEYEGKRAIIFNVNDEIPIDAVKDCIEMALMYHLNK